MTVYGRQDVVGASQHHWVCGTKLDLDAGDLCYWCSISVQIGIYVSVAKLR